jgi:aromatic ring hydroxylase
MPMSAAEYREALRRNCPVVCVEGRRVGAFVDEPLLAPGAAAPGANRVAAD